MRLGAETIIVEKGTRLFEAYKKTEILERFRHRFHIQERFITEEAKSKDLIISSRDNTGKIINSIELNRKDHWMVGVQFHPEFKSRPYSASPCYTAFIKECIKFKEKKNL